MKFNYTGRNLQVSEDMKMQTEAALGKLDKYFDTDVNCNVVFSHFKDNLIIEVTINLPGAFIRSEESDKDLRTALDRVSEVLTRQVVKHKAKLQKKYRGKDTIRIENIPDMAEASPAYDEEEEKIVKTKTYDLRPMMEEEAILQMELVGHNFYVFNNAETNEVNVIYKRNKGGYGILVPKA
ncbi:MAG: ribosome-associated translation inhibitor RaiA [Bacillota bacterium]|nr:ribosome-associated translation inhibitor RaiA [Bacillota bacterium]